MQVSQKSNESPKFSRTPVAAGVVLALASPALLAQESFQIEVDRTGQTRLTGIRCQTAGLARDIKMTQPCANGLVVIKINRQLYVLTRSELGTGKLNWAIEFFVSNPALAELVYR